jgi:hypothetical protein
VTKEPPPLVRWEGGMAWQSPARAALAGLSSAPLLIPWQPTTVCGCSASGTLIGGSVNFPWRLLHPARLPRQADDDRRRASDSTVYE